MRACRSHCVTCIKGAVNSDKRFFDCSLFTYAIALERVINVAIAISTSQKYFWKDNSPRIVLLLRIKLTTEYDRTGIVINYIRIRIRIRIIYEIASTIEKKNLQDFFLQYHLQRISFFQDYLINIIILN